MFFFVFGIIVENEVNKKGFYFVVDLGFNKHESKRNKGKKKKKKMLGFWRMKAARIERQEKEKGGEKERR